MCFQLTPRHQVIIFGEFRRISQILETTTAKQMKIATVLTH